MSYTLTPYQPMQLQSLVTVDETQGGILYLAGNCERVTVVIQGNGAVASGVLTIEEAFYLKESQPPFSGTWSLIQTINAVDVTAGAQQVVHIPGSVWALRVRVSTVIVGGTVDVFAWGN